MTRFPVRRRSVLPISVSVLALMLGLVPGGAAVSQTPTAAQIAANADLDVGERIRLVNRLGADFSCKNIASAACETRLDRQIRRTLDALPRAQRDARPAIRLAAWVAAQDVTAPSPTAEAQKDKKPKEKKAVVVEAPADPQATKLTREERAMRRLRREQRQAARAAADDDAKPAEVETEVVTKETSRSSNEEAAARRDGGNDTLLKILGAAGAVGAGIVIGQLLDNGDEVVSDEGDRVIVRRDGELFLRRDEGALLRRPGSQVRTETFADGSTRTTVNRKNGVRVVTVRDADGNSVRRVRILEDGTRVVLFDDTKPEAVARLTAQDLEEIQQARRAARLAESHDSNRADRLRKALAQERVAARRGFSLRQIRENVALREMAQPIDLDEINFRTGSAAISPREAEALADLGDAIARQIRRNPNEVFLIEGHTDAVGSETYNLALSDRRAESVALALTEYFDVPPESLVVQGYGENYLKIDTQGEARQNRRATVRRITQLLRSARRN